MLTRLINTSLWQCLKNYLNEELDNSDQNHNEKKRKDILIGLQEKLGRFNQPVIDECDSEKFKFSSVDTYLNYLHKAGYLYKPRYGTYGLAREIEIDLSISDVVNQAYGEKSQVVVGSVFKRLSKKLYQEDFFTEEEFDV